MRRAVLSIIAIVTACSSHTPVGPIVPTNWSVAFKTPGNIYAMTSAPDGAMFVSMFEGSVYRSVDQGVNWEAIVGPDTSRSLYERHMKLYAPSQHSFFGASGDQVLRWNESLGLRTEQTPISNSLRVCEGGGLISGHHLEAIWGRGENDVFAVGDQGLILHFDGIRWTVEANPLSAAARGPCWWYPEGFLRAIGGDHEHVYAAGTHTLRRTDDGNWVILPTPAQRGEQAGILAIVSPGGPPIFAVQFNHVDGGSVSNPIRLLQPVRGTGPDSWDVLWMGPYRDTPYAGTSSANDRTVFWSFGRDVWVVKGGTVTAYKMPMFTYQVRGVALVGSEAFVAGIAGDSSMVIRVPLE